MRWDPMNSSTCHHLSFFPWKEEQEDDAEFTYPEDKRRLSGTASAACGTSKARVLGAWVRMRRVDRLNLTLEPRPLFPEAAISLR